MTALDAVLDRYPVGPDPKDPNHDIQAAIREAYRLGHDDGRHARIPQGEETFIARLRRQQEESGGQEP